MNSDTVSDGESGEVGSVDASACRQCLSRPWYLVLFFRPEYHLSFLNPQTEHMNQSLVRGWGWGREDIIRFPQVAIYNSQLNQKYR